MYRQMDVGYMIALPGVEEEEEEENERGGQVGGGERTYCVCLAPASSLARSLSTLFGSHQEEEKNPQPASSGKPKPPGADTTEPTDRHAVHCRHSQLETQTERDRCLWWAYAKTERESETLMSSGVFVKSQVYRQRRKTDRLQGKEASGQRGKRKREEEPLRTERKEDKREGMPMVRRKNWVVFSSGVFLYQRRRRRR